MYVSLIYIYSYVYICICIHVNEYKILWHNNKCICRCITMIMCVSMFCIYTEDVCICVCSTSDYIE